MATEWVKGKSLEEVTKIKNSDIAKHLSLPPVKLHCSMLAEDAIKVCAHLCFFSIHTLTALSARRQSRIYCHGASYLTRGALRISSAFAR